MIQIIFDKKHIYTCDSATDFLELYATLNYVTLAPPLVNVEGARHLLAFRAFTEHYGELDLSLSDEDFVLQAASLGMFSVEKLNGLEKSCRLSEHGSKSFLWSV